MGEWKAPFRGKILTWLSIVLFVCHTQKNDAPGPRLFMRRWFELGTLGDTTYSANTGDKEFHQFPQKSEYIKWANSMVGVGARLTTGSGDPGLCDGVGSPHLIQHVAGVNVVSAGGELRSQVLFSGIPPVYEPLIRQYFEKPGTFDGPNETQYLKSPTPLKAAAKSSGG